MIVWTTSSDNEIVRTNRCENGIDILFIICSEVYASFLHFLLDEMYG